MQHMLSHILMNKNISMISTDYVPRLNISARLTFLFSSEFHGYNIRARVGFTHCQSANMFTCNQLITGKAQMTITNFSFFTQYNLFRFWPLAGTSPSAFHLRCVPTGWHRGLSGHHNREQHLPTLVTLPPSQSHDLGNPILFPHTPLEYEEIEKKWYFNHYKVFFLLISSS